MPIAYLDQKGVNTGAANFALSADLAVGAAAGRAIVGIGNINTSTTGLVATAEGGDLIPVVAGPYTGLSGTVPLSLFGALIPTGDASQNVNFTSTSVDGPGKWIRMAAFSGAAGLRAQDPLTDHVFVGIGAISRTFDTQPGDVIVVFGDDGVISGKLLTISNPGAVVVLNEVEFLAYVPAASSGSTTTVNLNVSGGGGNCQFGVVVLVPIPPPAGMAGNITTDDATPTGTITSLAPASLTGNITTDAAAPTGTLGAAPGTITTQPWKNDAGDPQPLLTVPLMTFLRRSDGVQVLTLANQVTSSSPTAPVIAVTNAALVPGVFYMVASWNADGSLYGIEPCQAA